MNKLLALQNVLYKNIMSSSCSVDYKYR